MYDELPPFSGFGHVCQQFPTQQITTPIAIFHGGRDSLGDMSTLLKQIPTPVLVREIINYEHLDFIWASDLGISVYPDIFDLIIQHTHPSFREVAYRRDEGEHNQRLLDNDSVYSDLQPEEMHFSEIRHGELQQSSASDDELRRQEFIIRGHPHNGDEESLTHSEPEFVTMVGASEDDDHRRSLQEIIEDSSENDDFAMS
ncbi:4287_t:CDS:2 [Acaulospora colombiana]|uniref:4287_t:CDS:1 n=1 Tax=Acaulospora colombiana TaxID=27376 RepID=A0ACA9K5A6_9GLOM|nr:4287_t:CDS:2 [Acaulospora colombiana]